MSVSKNIYWITSLRNTLKTFSKLRRYLLSKIIIHLLRFICFTRYRRVNSFISPNLKYHSIVSVFLAKYIYFLFFPAYLYLRKKKVLISISNIYAVGHIYPELDYLNRIIREGKNYSGFKVWYLHPKNELTIGMKEILSTDRVRLVESGVLNAFLYPLALRFFDLAIDAGQGNYVFQKTQNSINCQILKHRSVFRDRQVPYFCMRKKSLEYFPLRKDIELSEKFLSFLGSNRYVVIQIKDKVVNATAKAFDPITYLPTIEYYLEAGFKVIFAGREKMPADFHRLGVIDYANSDFANSKYDYMLIRNAHMVLASASGFAYIPDVLGVPLLSVNHFGISGYPGQKTIQIPALMRYNGVDVLFEEQVAHFYKIGQVTEVNDIPSAYDIQNCEGSDIFNAVLELEALIASSNYVKSSIQEIFNSYFPLENQGNGDSVVSNSFIIKHVDRMRKEDQVQISGYFLNT